MYYWINSYKSTLIWTESKPLDWIEIGTVNLQLGSRTIMVNVGSDKYNYDLLIDTNYKNNELCEGLVYNRSSLPILKSQLQKCVRRCKVDIGVNTAVALSTVYDTGPIKQYGLFDMLRRLTVIVIEDSVLTYNYSFLVWCLSVLSKGVYLSEYCVKNILEITKGTISLCYRDPTVYTDNSNKINVDQLYDGVVEKLNSSNIQLILSILFRSGYRGMECDHNMLIRAAYGWYIRMINGEFLEYLAMDTVVPIDKYICLSVDDIQEESIDFHCTNIITKIKEYVNMSDNKLKRLIWNNSSSVNVRINIVNSIIDDNNKCSEWCMIKYIFKIETDKIKNIIKSKENVMLVK